MLKRFSIVAIFLAAHIHVGAQEHKKLIVFNTTESAYEVQYGIAGKENAAVEPGVVDRYAIAPSTMKFMKTVTLKPNQYLSYDATNDIAQMEKQDSVKFEGFYLAVKYNNFMVPQVIKNKPYVVATIMDNISNPVNTILPENEAQFKKIFNNLKNSSYWFGGSDDSMKKIKEKKNLTEIKGGSVFHGGAQESVIHAGAQEHKKLIVFNATGLDYEMDYGIVGKSVYLRSPSTKFMKTVTLKPHQYLLYDATNDIVQMEKEGTVTFEGFYFGGFKHKDVLMPEVIDNAYVLITVLGGSDPYDQILPKNEAEFQEAFNIIKRGASIGNKTTAKQASFEIQGGSVIEKKK